VSSLLRRASEHRHLSVPAVRCIGEVAVGRVRERTGHLSGAWLLSGAVQGVRDGSDRWNRRRTFKTTYTWTARLHRTFVRCPSVLSGAPAEKVNGWFLSCWFEGLINRSVPALLR
jgi:hypothetical protein